MQNDLPRFEVYAMRYATRTAMRRDHFIGGDPHEASMPMDYYVWAIVGKTRTVVVDTGFSSAVALLRGREHLRCPADALRLIGIDAAEVQDVVITHMHYDHAGNLPKFPGARVHVQEAEMQFACGRHMRERVLAYSYECEDVVCAVRLNFAGRVTFCQGDTELCPGISLHLAGGHTPGMQFVRVHTQRGWVVLASDVAHYYENIEARRPFPIVADLPQMVDGWSRVNALADSAQHVIPGHDPLVMARYPAPRSSLEGIVARLDVDPLSSC
ncbi:N-acyl homoserine lactonase [Variovorax sp. SRS16]|uniref:N-acyl homoserine lactonase family protein n=1 Tax=Variovorax sp. SRS16 TaxID=282217 RepID=UPI0013160C74|nr:N-acyl homoserine lactonase [Variovorax sp. SRS16]